MSPLQCPNILIDLSSHRYQPSVRLALCLKRAHELTVYYSGIRVFGELEFWLSSIKVLTLIGV